MDAPRHSHLLQNCENKKTRELSQVFELKNRFSSF